MESWTAAGMRLNYPKGCVVRVKQEMRGEWIQSIATRLRDRLGEVVTHTFPSTKPLVSFPAIGRRSAVRMPFDKPETYLEIVTDEEEIKKWREEVAVTAARHALKISKKRLR